MHLAHPSGQLLMSHPGCIVFPLRCGHHWILLDHQPFVDAFLDSFTKHSDLISCFCDAHHNFAAKITQQDKRERLHRSLLTWLGDTLPKPNSSNNKGRHRLPPLPILRENLFLSTGQPILVHNCTLQANRALMAKVFGPHYQIVNPPPPPPPSLSSLPPPDLPDVVEPSTGSLNPVVPILIDLKTSQTNHPRIETVYRYINNHMQPCGYIYHPLDPQGQILPTSVSGLYFNRLSDATWKAAWEDTNRLNHDLEPTTITTKPKSPVVDIFPPHPYTEDPLFQSPRIDPTSVYFDEQNNELIFPMDDLIL